MTAERPIKQPRTPETKGRPDATPLVAPVTVASAEPVMEKMLEGKFPESHDVSVMVSRIAEDLKAQGIPLSSDDIRAIEQRAKQGFTLSPSGMKEQKPDIRIRDIPDVNLEEYKIVLEDFARNYGLNKRAWDTISGIMITSSLAGQALNGFYRRKFQSSTGFEDLTTAFRDQISRKELKLHERSLKQLADYVFHRGDGEHLDMKTAKNVGKLAWKAAWPVIVSPVYWFLDRQGQKIAGKMFMAERTKLQEQVNNRVADSLFMRNFEFLHDKSAAEMLETINRGKDASLDLMSAIYEELIPLKWSQAGSVLSQGIVNKWDAIAALGKKLTLDTRLKPNARRIQMQRAEELKQWDKVNTKLMTTLQGLETVRSAGNAEAGSDVLYGSLAERDFVEAGGLREKRMQDRTMNKLFDFLDISVPAVTEGFSLAKQMKATPDMKAESLFSHGVTAYFRVTGSQAEQQMLRQSFLQLTHLYVDRIIPDIQDIKRMEDLLGPYDLLDHPLGLRERARIPASQIKRFDIKIENLQFKNILRGVNLDIPQGSFVTIKGPSGIGKSTLFRHLVGLYKGDGGAVKYGGVDIDKIKKYGDTALSTRIAYANQNPQFLEDMTLRENLLLWAQKDVPATRIEGVLRDLHLDGLIDRLDTKSKHYSGGELRRIGIARALLKDPKVLFLDEPTANLDAASTVQVMKIIQELRRKRPDMTVVAITHDPVFEKISEKIVDFEQINPKQAAPVLGERQVFEAKAQA